MSQNLMAGQYADKIGNTWNQAANNLMESLNVNDLSSAYVKIFELPSFKETATFEYMVIGLRWGLSVPMNQLSKLLGPEIIMLEVGIVLMTTLISLSIIFMACTRIILKDNFLSTIITIILISNTAMLYQHFMGGLSQSFGSIGIAGILLSLVLFFKLDENESNNYNKNSIVFLSTFSWVGLIVTYITSAFIIMGTFISFCAIVTILNRNMFKSMSYVILSPILISFLVNPFLSYVLVSMSIDQSANLQTGYKSGIWQTPTQLLGLLTIYPPANRVIPTYATAIVMFSLILSTILLVFILKLLITTRKSPNMFAIFALNIFVINIVAFFISYFGPLNSDYIYNKISVYLSPFLIFSVIVILITDRSLAEYKMHMISGILVMVLIPAIYFTEKFSSPTESIKFSYQYSSLLENVTIQDYLYSKNFIQPYKMAYDFAGIFGAEYSVARAPNSANLSGRIDNELIIFCFTGDPDCKPGTPKISNPLIEAFGISLYESKLTTIEFNDLSAKERYQYNFDSFGWSGFEIDDRFLGGNPYFN